MLEELAPRVQRELHSLARPYLKRGRHDTFQHEARRQAGGPAPLIRYALACAFVLAAMVLGAFLWHRYQVKPLTDQDTLVLADFTNNTGEPLFDGTLREALAIRLEESAFLKVMSDEEMRRDLRRTGRSPDQHITNDIAREACIREGGKAMVSG